MGTARSYSVYPMLLMPSSCTAPGPLRNPAEPTVLLLRPGCLMQLLMCIESEGSGEAELLFSRCTHSHNEIIKSSGGWDGGIQGSESRAQADAWCPLAEK